jgi:hypothetical protein
MATVADECHCLAAKVPQHQPEGFKPLHAQNHVKGAEAGTVVADDEVFIGDVDVESGALAWSREMIPVGNRHAQPSTAGEGDADAISYGGVDEVVCGARVQELLQRGIADEDGDVHGAVFLVIQQFDAEQAFAGVAMPEQEFLITLETEAFDAAVSDLHRGEFLDSGLVDGGRGRCRCCHTCRRHRGTRGPGRFGDCAAGRLGRWYGCGVLLIGSCQHDRLIQGGRFM